MNNVKLYGLSTEYTENPKALFTDRPRFSWKIRAYSGYIQKSYRITVCSSIEKLEAGEYDLWDSGIIEDSSTVAVAYNGKPLRSGSRGCWRVENTGVDGVRAVSEAAEFELALLSGDDWQGSFQTVTGEYNDTAQYWRRPFTVRDAEIERARVYVCGLGFHELYLNGEKVGDEVLNPGVTDYSKQLLYCTYDVTPFLVKGGNCLGFILGNGWLGGKMLKFQCNIEYKDGQTDSFFSRHNPSELTVCDGPLRQNSIYGGETYDAREEERLKGWCTCGYRGWYDNGWVFSMNAPAPSGELVSQTLEPIKVIREFEGRVVYREGSRVIYDFGVNLSGWLKFTVKGARGERVTARHSELLKADGKGLETINLRTAKQTDVYILKGEGEETYCPRFTYHGFRYAELTLEGSAELLGVRAQWVRTSVKAVSEFDCSSPVLNRLHENAVMTEGDNIHSIMTDCPQRDERFGWLNDYSSRIYQQLYNYDVSRLYPKVVRDIYETQDEQGRLTDTAPFHIGQRPADPVCAALLLMCLAAYRHNGDKRLVEEYYVPCKKWVDYLYSRTEGGLLGYSYYGDWVAPYITSGRDCADDEKTDGCYVSSAYMYWYCKLMVRLAEITGSASDAEYYIAAGAKVKAAFNEKYFNKRTISYHTGSQAADSIALSLGLCEEKDRAALAAHIAGDIKKRDWHNTTGNQAYRHMMYALSDEGYTETVYKMLVNPTYPGWGYMVANGAVSVWERWEKEPQAEMNSFNHPMFSAYDGWLFAKTAGISVSEDSVGADRLTINPDVSEGIDRLYAKTETARGTVSVSRERVDGFAVYDFSLPYNTRTRIRIKDEKARVSGKTASVTRAEGYTEVIIYGGKCRIIAVR